MARSVLLIPGFTATDLIDQHDHLVFSAVDVNLGAHIRQEALHGENPSEWPALLGVEYAAGQEDPLRRSLKEGVDISPGRITGGPYASISRFAAGFPYDWRLDVRHNARLLGQYLAIPTPTEERWTLIGHSLGCLLIILASKIMQEPRAFSRCVQRIVLIAPPLSGAIEPAMALLLGLTDLGVENREYARRAVMTWPAIYQQLPSWSALVDNTDAHNTLPADQQLTSEGAWPLAAFPDRDQLRDRLARFRAARALLQFPFARMKGVDIHIIMGNDHETATSIQFGQPPLEIRAAQGDGTVSYTRVIDEFPSIAPQITTHPGMSTHSNLCGDSEVLSFIYKHVFSPPTAREPSLYT
jgi:pimeloyl-ACP methyl ester carboxylesterase